MAQRTIHPKLAPKQKLQRVIPKAPLVVQVKNLHPIGRPTKAFSQIRDYSWTPQMQQRGQQANTFLQPKTSKPIQGPMVIDVNSLTPKGRPTKAFSTMKDYSWTPQFQDKHKNDNIFLQPKTSNIPTSNPIIPKKPTNSPIKTGTVGNHPRTQTPTQSSMKSSWIDHYAYDSMTHELFMVVHGGKTYVWPNIHPQLAAKIVLGKATCRTDDPSLMHRWWIGKNPSLGAAYWTYLKGLVAHNVAKPPMVVQIGKKFLGKGRPTKAFARATKFAWTPQAKAKAQQNRMFRRWH